MKRSSGRLRIIGGQWRSRIVEFRASPGLRATPDRVRQTLFDWLAPWIRGAHCVDLFAGSGALGLEALSRGAASAVLVEADAQQARSLETAAQRLQAGDRAAVIHGDALAALDARAGGTRAFDIAFVDPPYDHALLEPALQRLAGRLAPQNRVYIEWRTGDPPRLPQGYRPLKSKTAGQVSYGLISYRSVEGEGT